MQCNLDFENGFEIENVFDQLEKNIAILTLNMNMFQPQLIFVTTATAGGGVFFPSWCTFQHRERKMLAKFGKL